MRVSFDYWHHGAPVPSPASPLVDSQADESSPAPPTAPPPVTPSGATLMPTFGRSPYSFNSTNQIGIAYVRVEIDGAGGMSSKQYWNHATEGWEDGPRVDSKHIIKLERLAPATDVENTVQCYFVPRGDRSPLSSPNVLAIPFVLDAQGVPTAVATDALSQPYLKISSGQDY